MYTNQQRISFAHLMKDVNSQQLDRKGTQEWEIIAAPSLATSSAQEIQIYQNQDEYVFAIQDMDLLEDFELDDLSQLDSLKDAKVMAYVQAGEFPSEFIQSIEFVYQAIHELHIDPDKITFVGAGIGGAHAQMLANTFGGNLFTHDAPPVAKMLDNTALLPGATYQTTLARMQLDPPGPNLAENIVERGSAVSENNAIFKHDDYIGSVKEIDSVSNVLPVISKASEKIAMSLSSFPEVPKSLTQINADGKSQTNVGNVNHKLAASAIKKLSPVTKVLAAISLGTDAYDLVREGGSHDVDVFINYLSDVSKSNEHIEELVIQAYQIYGMPVDENVEFELAQLANDIFEQQESLAFFSYDQMVDTIEYQLSKIMTEHGVNQDLIKERPVHDVVNFLEMPVNYALAKLDQLSDSSSIVAYMEQKLLGTEIKPNFESYAVVKFFDDFLRREFSTDVSELNQGLVEAANTVDFYLDEMVESAENTLDAAQQGIDRFSGLVEQVYNRFEQYVEYQVLQLQDTVQLNYEKITVEIDKVLPVLVERSQVIFEIDDLLEDYYQVFTEQVSELPTVNQLYSAVGEVLGRWSEFEANHKTPITSPIELGNFNEQLALLANDVGQTQTFLKDMHQQMIGGTEPEGANITANNADLVQMVDALSNKLSTVNDDILTLQTALSDMLKQATNPTHNLNENTHQSLANSRSTSEQDMRP